MSKVYIAIESFSAVIIFILLYASFFGIRQNTKKRAMFTNLLIANEIVVVVDVVTWLHINWSDRFILFSILLTATYIVPIYIVGLFSRYIYVHISEKSKTSRLPFDVIVIAATVVGFISLLLCATGKMFVIKDGKYFAGAYTHFYYLFYVVSLLALSVVIVGNSKRLGIHDLMAALSFCIFPLVSIIVSMVEKGINLAIPSMAINMLIVYIVLHSENESHLYIQSNIDELTGLYNRRAYEDDLKHHEENHAEPKFVYAAIDVNGLKQVNDNIGHSAGDEMICGAADCLKETFCDYGRIYRTGGDEFVVMFSADEDTVKHLSDSVEKAAGEWHGNIEENMAMSLNRFPWR
ncbi:MAG: GGDEF domain-containing protein [Treponema sp.]|nr:GGDEF domain-containing protein [Candidatus Treponema equifaecale]